MKSKESIQAKVEIHLGDISNAINTQAGKGHDKFFMAIPHYGEDLQPLITEALIEKYVISHGVSSEIWPDSFQYPTNIQSSGNIEMIWLVCEGDNADEITSRPQLSLKEYEDRLKITECLRPISKEKVKPI